MAKSNLDNHPYVKLAGCKSVAEFDKRFPTPESFFNAFPEHAPKHMQEGGQLQENPQSSYMQTFPVVNGKYQMGGAPNYAAMLQAITPPAQNYIYGPPRAYNAPGEQQESGDNTSALRQLECQEMGGYAAKPGYHFNGEKMVKSQGSGSYSNGVYFQEGGEVELMAKGGRPQRGQQSHGGGQEQQMQQAFMQFVQQIVQQHPELKVAIAHHDPKVMKELQQAFMQQMQQSQGQGQPQQQQQAPPQQQMQPSQGDPNQEQQMQQQPQGPPPQGMMKMGGNPFNPLKEFFRNGGLLQYGTGGPEDGNGRSDDGGNDYGDNGNGGTGDPDDQSKQDADALAKNDFSQFSGPSQTRDQYINQQFWKQQPTTGILPVAGFAANAITNGVQNRRNAEQIRDMGLSNNQTKYINMQGHGQTDTQGAIPNYNYSQSANLAYSRMGGKYQTGGKYTKGQEIDVDEKTLNEMLRQGYKIAKI